MIKKKNIEMLGSEERRINMKVRIKDTNMRRL